MSQNVTVQLGNVAFLMCKVDDGVEMVSQTTCQVHSIYLQQHILHFQIIIFMAEKRRTF
jgi:hypothetical protein